MPRRGVCLFREQKGVVPKLLFDQCLRLVSGLAKLFSHFD